MIKRRAFTLVELLVVIAIIALLMSILMPALQRVKKQARAVVCQSNLRQWGLVWAMYVQENDNKFPEMLGWDWMKRLVEYYRKSEKLLYCPMTTRTINEGAPIRYSVIFDGGARRGSYSVNEWIYDSDHTGAGRDLKDYWRTTANKGLDNAPVMGDGAWRCDAQPNHTDEPPEYEGQPRGGVNNDEIRIYCIPRHDNSINMLFADWSTRKVGLKGLWRLKWHRSSDVTAPLPVWPDWMSGFSEP